MFLLRKITITVDISIHALLAESDNRFGRPIDVQFVFLSTLSLRRATPSITGYFLHAVHFYPRSPCGERPSNLENTKPAEHFYPRSPCGERRGSRYLDNIEITISIHALLAESDDDLEPSSTRKLTFLSTLSLRRATWARGSRVTYVEFLSTLSLRRATTSL